MPINDHFEEERRARDKARLDELQQSSAQIAIALDSERQKLGGIAQQFIEGAITLSEFNLRFFEFLTAMNEFARQLEEIYMLEDSQRKEKKQ